MKTVLMFEGREVTPAEMREIAKSARPLGEMLREMGTKVETINGKAVTPKVQPAMPATKPARPSCSCPYCAAGERCGFSRLS
jgi:hypothetical protein